MKGANTKVVILLQHVNVSNQQVACLKLNSSTTCQLYLNKKMKELNVALSSVKSSLFFEAESRHS